MKMENILSGRPWKKPFIFAVIGEGKKVERKNIVRLTAQNGAFCAVFGE